MTHATIGDICQEKRRNQNISNNLYDKESTVCNSIAEGAFGVLKQNYGFRRLSRRGMGNVETEFTLFCLAYNINKYCNKLI